MSDYMWAVYRILNDPPGTPRELKCVKCKVALSASSLIPLAFSVVKAKKHAPTNGFVSIAYAFGGFLSLGSVFIFARIAYDSEQFNRMLIKEREMEIKKRRKHGGVIPATQSNSDTGGCPVMH